MNSKSGLTLPHYAILVTLCVGIPVDISVSVIIRHMGQRCFKPSVYGDLPTRIRITIEGADGSETLNLIPDSYESLVQSVYPFAASRLTVTAGDYLLVHFLKSATDAVRITRPKDFKKALKSCKGREMTVKITKANYQSALNLHLNSTNDNDTDAFLRKFSHALSEFRSLFMDFSKTLYQLLQLTSSLSIFTQHPNIEAAVTAVLVILISESTSDAMQLTVSTSSPFITAVVESLHPIALNTLRLWNDFTQFLPKLEPLNTSLKTHFQLLFTILKDQTGFKSKGKTDICSIDAALIAKQCFEDASTKYEATEEQLVRYFTRLEYDQTHHKPRFRALERICRLSKTQGLTSVLALFDLHGNARALEAVAKEDEADLPVD